MGRERLTTREANRRKKTLKRSVILSKSSQKSHNRPEDWPTPEELENLPSEEAHATTEEDTQPLKIDMTGKKAPSPEALETEVKSDEAPKEMESKTSEEEVPESGEEKSDK